MKVVVIGGTGVIGSKVVAKLDKHGHDAIAASPETGVNTFTGAGVEDALTGAQVVVDVSNSPSFEGGPARDFFTTATGNALTAAEAAGVSHYVALSVVGTDRLLASGYFRAKSAQERLISEAAIPFSIVRATQFYEFVERIADSATDGDTVRISAALCQPMAADDVASAVARTAAGQPVGGIHGVAGPGRYPLDYLVRARLRAQGDTRDPLIHAYAGFHTFQQGRKLKAWPFRILYNRWVSASAPKNAAQSKFRSTGSPNATWPIVPPGCRRTCALPRRKPWMHCLTTISGQRWTPCRTAFGQRCTTPTSRDTPTRKPPRFWAFRMGRLCHGCRGPGNGCASYWPTPPKDEATSALTNGSAPKSYSPAMKLVNPPALITGETASIGSACAQLLAPEGTSVITIGASCRSTAAALPSATQPERGMIDVEKL
jgi:uncharacterized protein YbjT (DUF2867 family)